MADIKCKRCRKAKATVWGMCEEAMCAECYAVHACDVCEDEEIPEGMEESK